MTPHYSSQLSRCRSRQGRLLYVDDPCADPNFAGEFCDQLLASHPLLLSLVESGLIACAHRCGRARRFSSPLCPGVGTELPTHDALDHHGRGAFLVKRFKQGGASFFLRQFFLFDLKVRFFVQIRTLLTPTRPSAVKVAQPRGMLRPCQAAP